MIPALTLTLGDVFHLLSGEISEKIKVVMFNPEAELKYFPP